MSQRCRVVVDSSASIPGVLAREWGIDVVPLEVIVSGESFPEGLGMTSEDVIEALEDGRYVTTSQPSVGALLEEYRRAAEAGAEGVVSIHISGEVSGTVNAAELAARKSPIPVEVVDSRTLSMALGFTALAAAAFAKKGAIRGEVAYEARRVAASSSVLFTVDTLDYLRRGGRVPHVMALIGGALNIRPILGMVDGRVEVLERVRTTARARKRVIEMLEEKVSTLSRPGVAVMGLRIPWFVDDVENRLKEKHPDFAMTVGADFSAALAVHGGSGSFLVAAADLPRGL